MKTFLSKLLLPLFAALAVVSCTKYETGPKVQTSLRAVLPTEMMNWGPKVALVGAPITIHGKFLEKTEAVSIGGQLTTFQTLAAKGIDKIRLADYGEPDKVIAPVPAGVQPSLPVRMKVDGVWYSSSDFFTLKGSGPAGPPPTVSGFSPSSALPGAGVVVTGTNFTNATNLTFGATAATFSVDSATQISTTVPAAAVTGKISVFSSNGSGISAADFTVLTPPPGAPTISGITPTSGTAGASVVITGTNFIGVVQVKFGALIATYTVDSPTQITATAPTGVATGKLMVSTVTGSATSNADFTVAVTPVIMSFTPVIGAVGSVVAISGNNLDTATVVKFGSTAASFVVVDNTEITATVPVGAVTGKISITSPFGTGMSAVNYTVVPLPIISSFSPASGPEGTVVTVNGSNFTGASVVGLGGFACPFTFLSDTQVTFTVANGVPSDKVRVSRAGGTGLSSATFNVTAPAPTISSFTPTSAVAGATVTVTGTNLTGATVVTVNGTAVTFTVVSNTQVTFTVPAGASSGPVRIVTPGGTAVSSTNFNAPTSPVSLKMGGHPFVNSGICSSAFDIELKDQAGVATVTSVPTTIGLYGKGHGEFYADSLCSTVVSSVVIPANQTGVSVYFKDNTTEGLLTFTAYHSGLASGYFGVSVSPDLWGNPSLGITGPATVPVDTCSSAYTITIAAQAYDAAVGFRNWATNSFPPVYGDWRFYANSTCSGDPISSIVIPAGQTSVTAYLKTSATGLIYVGPSLPGFGTSMAVTVTGAIVALKVAAGSTATCALYTDGQVKCWGLGAIGHPTLTQSSTPLLVSSLGNIVKDIAAGIDNFCAVKGDGSVWCWGNNGNGELGQGNFTNSKVPVRVLLDNGQPLFFAQEISMGVGFHACARLFDQSVRCWGDAGTGATGDGGPTGAARQKKLASPVVAVGNLDYQMLTGVVSLGSGAYHSCAIKTDAKAYCWGMNTAGQLGINNPAVPSSSVPMPVVGLVAALVKVSGGYAQTCFVAFNGAAGCVGRNSSGQLGDGTTSDRLTPVSVGMFNSAVSFVKTGTNHSCGVKSGSVYCWGFQSQGELGAGVMSGPNVLIPQLTHFLTGGVSDLSVGSGHSCAIQSGAVRCWGFGTWGQIGDGSNVNRSSPELVVVN